MENPLIEFDGAKSLSNVADLLCDGLNTSTVLVTRTTSNQQLVLAKAGVELPDKYSTCMPLSHSICQHTAAMDYLLVIDDVFVHPLLKNSIVISELLIAAYIGAPIHVQEGKAIGAICALERHQRRWSSSDIELITKAARTVDRLLIEVI